MYIIPNSDVRLLSGVPLENTYNDTVYFDSKSSQYNGFNQYYKMSLENYSYIRQNRGHLKVGVLADRIYDCNYMMYRNTAYGNKWFYAFITAIEYVNDNCSDITFELDDMQTWLFDYELQETFVEREHTETDHLFEHLVDEGLETGDYVSHGLQDFSLHPLAACVLTSRTANGDPVTPVVYNNVYVPVNIIKNFVVEDDSAVELLNREMANFIAAGQENAIIAAYEYPLEFGLGENTIGGSGMPTTKSMKLNTALITINGYTPKNNKLFIYPYNFILLSNNAGATAEYKYELFEHEDITTITNFEPEIYFTGVSITTPCVLAYPARYRGIANDFESGLTISNFPQIPFVGDTYKAYMAQAKGNIVGSLVSSSITGAIAGGVKGSAGGVAGTVGGAVGGGVVGLATGALTQVGQQVGEKMKAEATPPQVHGQVQCESLNAGMRRYKFTFYQMQIKPEFAKIIDKYFDKYGYKVNLVKKPNRHARPNWTFVKTIGCEITGRLPADNARNISSIYDKGVTWWDSLDKVGNYSLDNSPED